MTGDPHDFDERHAAFVAGMDTIPRELVERLAEQRAYELIHERSIEMLNLARHEARKKGPNWAQMIEEAAAEPWEVGA